MEQYKVVGVMSGTSLDGLDLAFCMFKKKPEGWVFELKEAETIEYDKEMSGYLSEAFNFNGPELIDKHAVYGRYIGFEINKFLKRHNLKAGLVASHGHTVFHQPGRGWTFQLGSGAHIAAATGLDTVSDFRLLDTAYGGQGAPLVPVGDELLFNQYDFCLNFGGFSNISFKDKGQRIAFDICPVNIFINQWMNKAGKPFDDKGQTGATGLINAQLLNKLNGIVYYKEQHPKSLGREWFEDVFMKVVLSFDDSFENILRTVYEHIAIQVANTLNRKKEGNVFLTGGGAFNDFLVSLITAKTAVRIVIPDAMLVKYKEALIFGFLGVLRYRNEINCFASVTGALSDTSSGTIHIAAPGR
ncbi:MAG: anhydro-N-acetylmuramic acid kinase [Bacteroidales bacterium]|nr:anhydro-N-acetylmuramic acid kinase [Bacteroidales bacterium]